MNEQHRSASLYKIKLKSETAAIIEILIDVEKFNSLVKSINSQMFLRVQQRNNFESIWIYSPADIDTTDEGFIDYTKMSVDIEANLVDEIDEQYVNILRRSPLWVIVLKSSDGKSYYKMYIEKDSDYILKRLLYTGE